MVIFCMVLKVLCISRMVVNSGSCVGSGMKISEIKVSVIISWVFSI